MGTENRIQLYDYPSSPNCQRVKIVLEEKKLPYETVLVDLKKREQKRADFLKLNPYSKVPVIIDGDTVLYESCIINEYLEEKYPEPPLMPRAPARRAKIRILIDFGMNHLNDPYQKIRAEAMKEQKERNQELLDAAKKDLVNLLLRLEREIGDRDFLAGELSLLDIALIPRMSRLEAMGILPHPSLPKLGAWTDRMRARPSVQAACG